MQYSRGKPEELIEKFVKMYVNPVTVNMGDSGEKSIRKMFEMAREKDLVPEFEIKISGMNRLWGQSNFENIIRDQSSWNDTEKPLEFREISKKYYFYD